MYAIDDTKQSIITSCHILRKLTSKTNCYQTVNCLCISYSRTITSYFWTGMWIVNCKCAKWDVCGHPSFFTLCTLISLAHPLIEWQLRDLCHFAYLKYEPRARNFISAYCDSPKARVIMKILYKFEKGVHHISHMYKMAWQLFQMEECSHNFLIG